MLIDEIPPTINIIANSNALYTGPILEFNGTTVEVGSMLTFKVCITNNNPICNITNNYTLKVNLASSLEYFVNNSKLDILPQKTKSCFVTLIVPQTTIPDIYHNIKISVLNNKLQIVKCFSHSFFVTKQSDD